MRTSGRVEADGGSHRAAARGVARGPPLRLRARRSWCGRPASTSSPPSSRARCRSLPIFADQVLRVGPAGYGWLVSAPALGRARRLALHLAPPPAGAPGAAAPRLRGLLRRRHRRLRPLALVLADLPRPRPQRARRPRLHRDPADAAAAAHPRRPARPDDLGQHDLLHGRAAAGRDGGRPRGVALRLRRGRSDGVGRLRRARDRAPRRAWSGSRRPSCATTCSRRPRPPPERRPPRPSGRRPPPVAYCRPWPTSSSS